MVTDTPLPMENDGSAEPLKSYRTILEQEIVLADEELERPLLGLLTSGFIAGFGIGTSMLVMVALMTAAGPDHVGAGSMLLLGTAYSLGFILIILARTDLFTEYTTLAILPVLTGHGTIRQLARLWSVVYAGNLAGGALFAVLFVWLGPRMGVAAPWALQAAAERLGSVDATTMLVSAVLAGWLMGMMSWLIAAARETISQVFFIWLIATMIGIGHLHHAVLGAIEMLAGVLAGGAVTLADLGGFMLWTTLGNAAGGVAFAVLIRFGMVIGRQSGRHGSNRRDN